jgi:hypothetical protein
VTGTQSVNLRWHDSSTFHFSPIRPILSKRDHFIQGDTLLLIIEGTKNDIDFGRLLAPARFLELIYVEKQESA